MSRPKGSVGLTVPEVERAKSLAALGYSYRRIGKELGRSDHAIAKLLRVPEVAAAVVEQKAELSDMFERLAVRTLEAVSAKDIEKASLQQKAISSGIFIDKSRLLRGESTSNVNISALLSVASLLRDRDDPPHALPAAPQIQPSPQQIQPPSLSTSEPQPIPRVARYYDVPASPIAKNESLLFRGLRNAHS